MSEQPPKSWSSWPVCLIAFLGLVILSSVGFVVFCIRQPADLVAQNYYEQEIRYQAHINRAANGRVVASAEVIRYEPASARITIQLRALETDTQPKGRIELYRPSSSHLDKEVTLALDKDGRQTIDARNLASGLWKVKVFWTVGNAEFYVDKPVVIESTPRS
jgi:nitrogen fixation protein FixH